MINNESMDHCVNQPHTEYTVAETRTAHSNFVKFGLLHKRLFRILKIKKCEIHDRNRCHCDVVELVDQRLVHRLAREARIESKIEPSYHVHHVFVEGILDQHRVSTISFATMDEQQWFQILKL